MDFGLDPRHEDMRQRIRSIIDDVVDDGVIADVQRTGTKHWAPLSQAFGEAGVLRDAMPGAGQDPMALFLLSSECQKQKAPFDSIGMALVIAGVLNEAASPFLRDRVLEGLLSGEDVVCFGLTEADGGSDLAALRTRAVRDGDEWVINGSKMWTTMAHIADWVFLLARTDPALGRYGGFTVFMLPMATPGISVDAIETVSGVRANATFYDDVRVGDEWVLGTVDDGWQVLSVMLGFERGMATAGAMVPLLSRTIGWAEASGRLDDPQIRTRLAQIALDAEVADLLSQRTVWSATEGEASGTFGSIAKVFVTERHQRHARWAQATAGPTGLLGVGAPGAAAGGWFDHEVRESIAQTFQGGTTEINRNNIAERHLGLPRAR